MNCDNVGRDLRGIHVRLIFQQTAQLIDACVGDRSSVDLYIKSVQTQKCFGRFQNCYHLWEGLAYQLCLCTSSFLEIDT